MDSDDQLARPGPGDPRFQWRPLAIIAALFGLLVALFGLLGAYWFAHNRVAASAAELPYDQFAHALNDGRIFQDDKHPLNLLIEEGSSIQTITGFYSNLLPVHDHLDQLQPFHTTISLDYDKDLKAHLKAVHLTPNEIRDKSNLIATTLLGFLPILIFLLMLGLIIGVVIRLFSSAKQRLDPAAPR